MTYTALPQLQTAIVARLTGNAPFMALAKAVLDDVPPTQTFPYVAFDDPFESPDRTFGQNGHDATCVLSIYTRDGSDARSGTGTAGFKQGLTIAEAALALLTDIENNPLIVSGHDVVDVDVISLESFREPDGKTRRTDVIITATLEDAS